MWNNYHHFPQVWDQEGQVPGAAAARLSGYLCIWSIFLFSSKSSTIREFEGKLAHFFKPVLLLEKQKQASVPFKFGGKK